MKKTKKFFVILIMLLFLVTGCSQSWTDVYNEYSDKIGTGIKCNYVADESGNKDNEILYLNLTIEKKGISASIAGTDKVFNTNFDIVSESSPDNYILTFEYKGLTYDIQDLELDDFVNYYYENEQCPPLYFVKTSLLFKYMANASTSDSYNYAIFYDKKDNINFSESQNEDETHSTPPEIPDNENAPTDKAIGQDDFSCYYSKKDGSNSNNTINYLRLDAFKDSFKIYYIKDSQLTCDIDEYALLLDSTNSDHFYDPTGRYQFYMPKEEFNYEDFRKYYEVNQKCPSLYFLQVATLFRIDNENNYKKSSESLASKYAVFDETLKCEDNKALTDECVATGASSCRTYNALNANKEIIYIQIGELNNGKIYMAVSEDASFNSFEISDISFSGTNGLGLTVKYKNVFYVIASDKVFEPTGYTSNINLCYGNAGSELTYSIVPSDTDCVQKRYVRSKDSRLDGVLTCSNIFGTNGEIKQILKNIMNFIKYGGPILMLLLTIVDLVKTSVSGEDKDFKKVFQNFIKRFIAAALLFFIKDIINLLFFIVGIANPTDCILD